MGNEYEKIGLIIIYIFFLQNFFISSTYIDPVLRSKFRSIIDYIARCLIFIYHVEDAQSYCPVELLTVIALVVWGSCNSNTTYSHEDVLLRLYAMFHFLCFGITLLNVSIEISRDIVKYNAILKIYFEEKPEIHIFYIYKFKCLGFSSIFLFL